MSDRSGFSVSLSSDGNIVAIGAPLNDGSSNDAGHVRIYENAGGVLSQIGGDIDGELPNDQSGDFISLSSDGSVVAIGAFVNDGNGPDSGHTRVYDLNTLTIETFDSFSFKVFPNPAKTFFNIQLSKGEVEKIGIYNHLGQLLNHQKQGTVDITQLSSGLYFVEVISNLGRSTQKVLIE